MDGSYVTVVPEFGVVAAYVESGCDTPKGFAYRRKLIVTELPALAPVADVARH